VGGVNARLFRISFSGEKAYELAVPAGYGDSLFRVLVARSEALKGGAYGMEALNVLRIEKGFITHAEIHGRTTAFEPDAPTTSDHDLGYVTSVCFSPTLGHSIGQAFLSNGPARMGQTIKMVDAVRGIEALCEVCDPVFYDPDGGLLRG